MILNLLLIFVHDHHLTCRITKANLHVRLPEYQGRRRVYESVDREDHHQLTTSTSLVGYKILVSLTNFCYTERSITITRTPPAITLEWLRSVKRALALLLSG